MRTTVTLDDQLLARAISLSGVAERGPLLREALLALIERERPAPRTARRHRARARGGTAPAHRSMILADTSVWIDHLRKGDEQLAGLLEAGLIVCHPFVVAEIALGSLRARAEMLGLLDGVAALPVAEPQEIRALIERRGLFGRGIGFVDASLVAACLLAPGTQLWTRDRRLDAVAANLGLRRAALS